MRRAKEEDEGEDRERERVGVCEAREQELQQNYGDGGTDLEEEVGRRRYY
jgi:hypothetical protein